MKTFEEERDKFAIENYDRSKQDVILGANWSKEYFEKKILEIKEKYNELKKQINLNEETKT